MVGLTTLPLHNIQLIEVKKEKTKVIYKDGTSHLIKGEVNFVANYKNENDYPLVDHCI